MVKPGSDHNYLLHREVTIGKETTNMIKDDKEDLRRLGLARDTNSW